jgi:phosphatidate cytidylyltransferase
MNDKKPSQTLPRILSALVGLPLYAFCMVTDLWFNIPVLAASMIVTLVSLYEFYRLSDRHPAGEPFLVVGMIYGVIINIGMYLLAFGSRYGWMDNLDVVAFPVFLGALSFLVALLMVLELWMRPIKGGTYSISVTLAGLFIIVIPFSHVILMKSMLHGVFYILILNITVMLNDSGAYFGGVLFGKHKTYFAVSPNKSWEGYAAGFIVSVLAVVGLDLFFQQFFKVDLFTLKEGIFVGLLLSFLATMGDLSESLIKRDASAKDSGTLIPGHGGMWDTFDAMIYSFPIFYYYLLIRGAV